MTRHIVTVVCSDRGTHPSRLLAELVDRRGDDPHPLFPIDEEGPGWHRFLATGREPRPRAPGRAHTGFRSGRHPGDAQPDEEGGSTWGLGRGPGRDITRAWVDDQGVHVPPGWEFGCPTCKRDLRLREEVLGRAVDALRAVATEPDRVRLDISHLPF